jgi:hypothetical protein
MTITLGGRLYEVETLPPGQLDEGRPVYRLTGKRGATYHTVRNRPNPDLMFLIVEGARFGVLRNVWLTDKGGELRAASVVSARGR